MKLKLLFENEIVIEIIIKPERKWQLCHYHTLMQIVKINYIRCVTWYVCDS